MMRFCIFIFALIAAQAAAIEFRVEQNNQTCLLLRLNGTVRLTDDKTVHPQQFDKATLNNLSDCTVIKLDLGNSIQVWFEFNDISGDWAVTPFTQFVPHEVFNTTNGTDTVVYKTDPLEKHFYKNQSYNCIAQTDLNFTKPAGPELNISVTVLTTNFAIQSLNSSGFVHGVSCKADEPVTTPAPTTPKPIPTTTIQPSYEQNFSCEADNATKFRLYGSFILDITYTTDKNKSATVPINVPQVHISSNDTECSSKLNETLKFEFFDGWSIEFIFKLDGTKYYVSNITVTYVHDHHFPNSSVNTTAVAHFGQVGYLEATTSGYYTCKDISLQVNPQVKLTTKEFKYKAFNDKGDIDFRSGSVSECSKDEETSSVVPIAVGAALAGLVVIVLIAYLIGRRRSRKAGYESV